VVLVDGGDVVGVAAAGVEIFENVPAALRTNNTERLETATRTVAKRKRWAG